MGGEGPDARSDFEEELAALERIVERLERDELTLDEALQLFEAGVGHLRSASRFLDEARGRVEELIEDASGDLAVVEFEPTERDADAPETKEDGG